MKIWKIVSSSAFVLLTLLPAAAEEGNLLANPAFAIRKGSDFPYGWERAYRWQAENFSFPAPGKLRLSSPDGQRTLQSVPMPVPKGRDLRFTVHVAAESGKVKGHIYLIDGKFGWCRPTAFEVDTIGRMVEVHAFSSDYRQDDRKDFYARVDIDSKGALLIEDPKVCAIANSPLPGLLHDDMIAVWGGDDVYSWNNRRRGDVVAGHPVVMPDFFAGLWREDPLLEGHLKLFLPYRSVYRSRFVKFKLGEIRTPLTAGTPPAIESFQDGYLGVCSFGEHVDNNRFSYNTISDGTNSMTRITTPFHPAWALCSDGEWIRFFSDMRDFGQPGGPAYAALPLRRGITVRRLHPDQPLYETGRDGRLAAGWILVWFADPSGDRDVDVPLQLTFSSCPNRILADNGLLLEYPGRKNRRYSLLPLFGVDALPASETGSWRKTLPKAVEERASFWYRATLRIPVMAHDRYEVLPDGKRMRFETRFEYTDRLDEWPEIEALALAPVSPLLALSFPEVPEEWRGVRDLKMPLFKGPLYAAVNREEVAIELEMPRLRGNPDVDLPRLSADATGRKMLDFLNSGRYLDYLTRRFEHERKSAEPKAHVAVEWEGMRVYPFLTPDNRAAYAEIARRGFREIIFNPVWHSRFYPVKDVYPGKEFEYLNLTVPYGCQESYWNLGRILAALGDYTLYTGDESIYRENWALIRKMAWLIELGGFYQYRYDGGRTLGAVLEGLLRGAGIAGDQDYYRRIQAIYTLYANTIAGFFRFGDYLRDHGMWNIDGANAEMLGGFVQNLTRQNYFTAYDVRNTVWQALGYDLAYGNYHLLRQYAAEPIRKIEMEYMPRTGVDWLKVDDPKRAPNPGFRFAARALVLEEDPEVLREYLRKLFEQTDFREDYQYYGPYEAAVAYLLRLNGEQKKRALLLPAAGKR